MTMAGFAGAAGKVLAKMMSGDTIKAAEAINVINVCGDFNYSDPSMAKIKEWIEQAQKAAGGNPEKLETVEVPEEVRKELEAYVKSAMSLQFTPLYMGGVMFQFSKELSGPEEDFLKEILDNFQTKEIEWSADELEKAQKAQEDQENVDNFMDCYSNGYKIFKDTLAIDFDIAEDEEEPAVGEVRSFAESINRLCEDFYISGYAFY